MKNLFLASLLLLLACGGPALPDTPAAGQVVMQSDIDGLVGWLPDPNALSKGPAHSGQYCLRVDQGHEFSLGYTGLLGQLSPARLRGLRLSAWAYATDRNAKAKLEAVVRNAQGQELLREQLKLNEVTAYGQWQQVSRDIVLPATADQFSQLFIYVSRAEATSPAYVDDLQLTALR